MIYSNSSIVTIGSFLSKKIKKKHIWHIREFGVEDYNLRYIFGKKSLIKKLHKSQYVVFISESIRKSYYGKALLNGMVIYDGIVHKLNEQPFIPRTRKKGVFTFAIIGVIQPQKGQVFAINSFLKLVNKNENVELKIFGGVGNQDYYNQILEIIRKNELHSKVLLSGFESDIDNIYRDVDCTLVCSEKEGLGRVVIESMNKGIPVIASNSGGPSEIIESGKNGLLYNIASEADLTYKLTRIYKEKELYEKLSIQGQVTASKFGIEDYSKKIYNLIVK